MALQTTYAAPGAKRSTSSTSVLITDTSAAAPKTEGLFTDSREILSPQAQSSQLKDASRSTKDSISSSESETLAVRSHRSFIPSKRSHLLRQQAQTKNLPLPSEQTLEYTQVARDSLVRKRNKRAMSPTDAPERKRLHVQNSLSDDESDVRSYSGSSGTSSLLMTSCFSAC